MPFFSCAKNTASSLVLYCRFYNVTLSGEETNVTTMCVITYVGLAVMRVGVVVPLIITIEVGSLLVVPILV